MEKLDALRVSKMAEPGLYADGGGLYLQVSATGLKSWIFRFMLDGRRRDMGLGRYGTRDVTLAEARDRAAAARRQVKEGIDPIETRRAIRAARTAERASAKTFKDCADLYIRAHEPAWKNAKHASQWRNTLETYVHPKIGALPVNQLDTALVLSVIEPIWSSKTETANRVRGRIEVILDWARTRGLRTGENPARWKGHLDKLLPKKSRVQRVEHHAALPYAQVSDFMKQLAKQSGTSALAFRFAILTASRTSEVLGARWHEFDLSRGLWTIPAGRMKAGRDHRVPLSDAALRIIEVVRGLSDEFVFPGLKPQQPLSNMAFLMLLRRMDRTEITVHGFRSTFRDWAAEATNYPAEVAEMALAHAVGDKVEAAYRRGDLFQKRLELMQDWGRYCADTLSK